MKSKDIIPAAEQPIRQKLPLFGSNVRAGFPSPADDFIDKYLDLNEHLVPRPSSTFFAHAEGDSLQGICITNRDLLIIDRTAQRVHGSVVVVAIDGELACKILDLKNHRLLSANNKYPPIAISEEELLIEGVVTYSIKRHGR